MNNGVVVVLADDLTGALDATAAFGRRQPAEVWLRPPLPAATAGERGVLGVDLGTRNLGPATATRLAGEAVAAVPERCLLYRKVDSLLRGQPGVEVRATLAAATDRFGGDWIALVAPAFPDTGRTTVDGLVRLAHEESPVIDGVGTFQAAGLHTAAVELSTVRRGAGSLAGHLARLVASGVTAAVLDAATVEDLRVVAAAGRQLATQSATNPCHVLWAGSAGLAGELSGVPDADVAPTGAEEPDMRGRPPAETAHRPILAVVGTGHPVARRQLELFLARRGPSHVQLPTAVLLASDHPAAAENQAQLAAAAERDADLVVSIEPGPGSDGTHDNRLSEAVAARLAPVAERFGGLILTGGATASAVLQAMGVTSVQVCGELEPGIVVSTPTGDPARVVVTKSGGFGDDHTLVRAYDAVARQSQTNLTTTDRRTAP